MEGTSNNFKLSLKLLIDTNGQRVLFAEADKKAVDFLFHILTLPIGTVIKLLTKQQMVGSLGNIYDSIKNLSITYIQPSQSKEIFLNLITPAGAANFSCPLLTLPEHRDNPTFQIIIYRCQKHDKVDCDKFFSDDMGAVCPSCKTLMSEKIEYVAPPVISEVEKPAGEYVDGSDQQCGFVKGLVTYMVMDDLEVKPMSTISSIAMLNKFNVKEVAALEEKVVDLGINEALNLLKTSLTSKTVLSTVFLKNMNP